MEQTKKQKQKQGTYCFNTKAVSPEEQKELINQKSEADMDKIKELNELLYDLEDEMDISWAFEESSGNADRFIEIVSDLIKECEIIYYKKAMEYLSEVDNSLQESISIATENGYVIGDVTSELLATLHFQNFLNEVLHSKEEAIKEIFEASEEEE